MGTLYETSSLGVGHNTTKTSQKSPKNLQAQGDQILFQDPHGKPQP